MLQLYVPAKHRYVKIVHFHKLHFYISFSNFMLWQCCASGQFRFRHKSNLVRVAHLEIVLNTHTTITYVTRKCPNISLKLSAFVTTNTAGSFKISRGFHAQCKNTIMNRGFSFVSHPIKNIQLWYHWCHKISVFVTTNVAGKCPETYHYTGKCLLCSLCCIYASFMLISMPLWSPAYVTGQHNVLFVPT